MQRIKIKILQLLQVLPDELKTLWVPLKPPVEWDPDLRGEDGADSVFLHVADGLDLDGMADEVDLDLPEAEVDEQSLSVKVWASRSEHQIQTRDLASLGRTHFEEVDWDGENN